MNCDNVKNDQEDTPKLYLVDDEFEHKNSIPDIPVFVESNQSIDCKNNSINTTICAPIAIKPYIPHTITALCHSVAISTPEDSVLTPLPIKKKSTILLFDIDGTLTKPRKPIDKHMVEFLQHIKQYATIGLIGGSDMQKIEEQMGKDVTKQFTYVFAENGLTAYQDGICIHKQNLKTRYSERDLQAFINYCLHYIADIALPVKRGTFIEFRNGMINISPIGRNCTQKERDEFAAYDKRYQVRKTMIRRLKSAFSYMNFTYSIGGQISFDVFPKGWDKTYCLQFLNLDKNNKPTIHFFGDKTYEGGNDYEIFLSEHVIGHSVRCSDDTCVDVINVLNKTTSNKTPTTSLHCDSRLAEARADHHTATLNDNLSIRQRKQIERWVADEVGSNDSTKPEPKRKLFDNYYCCAIL